MKRLVCISLALASSLVLGTPGFAEVKLGIAGPLTGSSASFGAQMKNGVQQAVEDLNAKGGILGEKISLSIGDDAGDPKQGVSVANKFVGDGVKYVVGHFNSGVSIPASEVYNENNILQISPASTNPNLTERKLSNVFRVCGRDDQQGKIAGDYITKHFGKKKIAIIHDKTTYGKGLADETKKILAQSKIEPVLYEGLNTGEKDYSAIVSKIKSSEADLVYFGGLYTEAGLLIRQMRDQGVKAPLMGGDGIVSEEFTAIAGPGVEGTLMTYGPDPTKRPNAAAIVKKFQAKKINPEAYTLYAYAAVEVIQQAAEKAKSLDPKKIEEVMHSGYTFDTMLGKISFDAKGDRTDSDYVVYVWKKGPDGKFAYHQL